MAVSDVYFIHLRFLPLAVQNSLATSEQKRVVLQKWTLFRQLNTIYLYITIHTIYCFKLEEIYYFEKLFCPK